MNPLQPRVLVIPASNFARNRTLGGGERYALELARALAQRTPTTHALFDTTTSTAQDGALTLQTYSVRHLDDAWVFPGTTDTWKAIAQFDVLHLMCFPTRLSETLVVRGRLRGQKIVLTDVGGGGRTLSGYLQKFHRRWDLHRLAHGLAHLSVHAGQFYRDWSQPSTTLFGGVNPKLLGNEAGEPRGYALFVGRLLPHKGILEAIQAVPPNVPFRVVGRPYSPEYFAQIQAAAAGKQVTFITDADDAELARQYAGANVVLQVSLPTPGGQPDKSELLGLVALEGMAGGKPVIVTRTTSLPELVEDGVTGYIVPPRDLAALGTRMEQLVRDPELSRRLGQQARAHVQRRFTWDRVADVTLDFYRRLLSGHAHAARS